MYATKENQISGAPAFPDAFISPPRSEAESPRPNDSFQSASIGENSTALGRPLAMGEGHVTIAGKKERFTFEVGKFVDGVAKLVVDAPTAATQFFGAIGSVVSTLVKKPAVALAAAGIAVGASAEASKAALIPNGANDPDYVTFGEQYSGNMALSLRILVPGFGSGERDTSATFLNSEYAITAAHNVADLLSLNPTYEVATGNNYISNRGTVIPVASVVIYPGYDGTNNTPDIALIHFSQPVQGITPNTISSASIGEVVTAAGFGHHGTPDTGSLPQDGNVRAWEAAVEQGVPLNVSPTYYMMTTFDSGLFSDIPMNGKGLSGDSGGPTFDSSGQLVGINIAQVGDTGQLGATVFLNLSQPTVNAWITSSTSVPEPTSLGLLGLGASALLSRRRSPK